MTVNIKLKNLNGSLVVNKSYIPIKSGLQTIKLTGSNGSLVSYPTNVPTVSTAAINDLSQFPNTVTVLAYDATTYANAVAYVIANYTSTNSLQLNTLNDIDAPPTISNNSTLVYDTTTNKYVVKQVDLNGGTF
jgi:hypothetical protein